MSQGKIPRPAKGFCVKVELKMTSDKGLGVFAAEFIPASTIVMDESTGTVYYD